MKIISSQPFLCGKNGKSQPPLPPPGVDANRSDDTLSLKISCRNAARTIRGGGDFSTLWRLCIESPSQPKLASSLHNKRLSYWRLTRFGRNDGGRGSAFLKSAPEGRHHHPQRQSRCRPLSEAMQPFYTTCGASRAPLKIAAKPPPPPSGQRPRQT